MRRDNYWTLITLHGLTLVVIITGATFFATASTPADETTGVLVSLVGLVIGLVSTVARSVTDVQSQLYADVDVDVAVAAAVAEDGRGDDDADSPQPRPIDLEHRDVSRQLQSAHDLTQVASLLGFTIVTVMSVAAIVTGSPQRAAIGLVTVAAVFSTFIIRTFQRTHERTLEQRIHYSQHSMESAREEEKVEKAEKLMEKVTDPALKNELLARMVTALCTSIAQGQEEAEPGPTEGSAPA
jgi:hypothetical protein